jgi:hypothetical protein
VYGRSRHLAAPRPRAQFAARRDGDPPALALTPEETFVTADIRIEPQEVGFGHMSRPRSRYRKPAASKAHPILRPQRYAAAAVLGTEGCSMACPLTPYISIMGRQSLPRLPDSSTRAIRPCSPRGEACWLG